MADVYEVTVTYRVDVGHPSIEGIVVTREGATSNDYGDAAALREITKTVRDFGNSDAITFVSAQIAPVDVDLSEIAGTRVVSASVRRYWALVCETCGAEVGTACVDVADRSRPLLHSVHAPRHRAYYDIVTQIGLDRG